MPSPRKWYALLATCSFALVSLSANRCYAQGTATGKERLVSLMFFDAADENLRESLLLDKGLLVRRFKDVFSAADDPARKDRLTLTVWPPDKKSNEGGTGNVGARNDAVPPTYDNIKPDTIKTAVKNASVTADDTLFVYYGGHGEIGEKGHVLKLSGGELARDELIDEMLKKNARLTVLITDSCAEVIKRKVQDRIAMTVRDPQANWDVAKQLFFQHSGLVDVNGCAPGESAWSTALTDTKTGKVIGFRDSILSNQLGQLLCEPTTKFGDGTKPVTWEAFFGVMQKGVDADFKKLKTAVLVDETVLDASGLDKIRVQTTQTLWTNSIRPHVRLGIRVEDKAETVEVVEVVEGRPASGKLQTGDVVLKVNGQTVNTTKDFGIAIDRAAKYKNGRPEKDVEIEVKRGDKTVPVTIALKY